MNKVCPPTLKSFYPKNNIAYNSVLSKKKQVLVLIYGMVIYYTLKLIFSNNNAHRDIYDSPGLIMRQTKTCPPPPSI